jgi:hypothetical protein
MSNPTTVVTPLSPREKRQRAPSALPIIFFKQTFDLYIKTLSWKQEGAAQGDVANYNKQFIDVLDDLRLEVQEQGIDVRGSKVNYLNRLRELGQQAYAQFFPFAAQEAIEREDEREYLKRGLSVTFTVPPEWSLLWEMLYAGGDSLCPEVEPNRFWGFRYQLGRTYHGIDTPEHISLHEGAFSGSHDGLKFPKEEVQELEECLRAICEQLGLKVSMVLLDQALAIEAPTATGFIRLLASNEFRYGIIHFACHCEDDPEKGANQAYLRLTAAGKELRVSLGELQAAQPKHRLVYRPFVFLNACDSSTQGHLLQVLTFPTGMLRFGAGGVIATACAMPDNFASAFARHFYRQLLRRPQDDSPPELYIGEALLATRLHFLETYGNPLGLAYGLYAVPNPELRLTD